MNRALLVLMVLGAASPAQARWNPLRYVDPDGRRFIEYQVDRTTGLANPQATYSAGFSAHVKDLRALPWVGHLIGLMEDDTSFDLGFFDKGVGGRNYLTSPLKSEPTNETNVFADPAQHMADLNQMGIPTYSMDVEHKVNSAHELGHAFAWWLADWVGIHQADDTIASGIVGRFSNLSAYVFDTVARSHYNAGSRPLDEFLEPEHPQYNVEPDTKPIPPDPFQ